MWPGLDQRPPGRRPRPGPGYTAIGYDVVSRPVKPLDLHATILHALGIDSERQVYDHHGLKETPLGAIGGAAVKEVFG